MVTSYTIEQSSDGGKTWTPSRTAGLLGELTRSATVIGLVNGTAYTFRIKATNALGDSPYSVPSQPINPRESYAPGWATERAAKIWTASPASASRVFSAKGGNTQYVVGVRSGSDVSTENYVTVLVQPVAPTLTLAANQTATERVARAINLGTIGGVAGDGVDATGNLFDVGVSWWKNGVGSAVNPEGAILGRRKPVGAASESLTFKDDGTYTVRVVVTDNDGQTAEREFSVAVAAGTPAAAIGVPTGLALFEGQSAMLTGLPTKAGFTAGDFKSYSWMVWRNGIVLPDAAATTKDYVFRPLDGGTYSVRFEATDDNGKSATASTTIVVGQRGPSAVILGVPATYVAAGARVELTAAATGGGTNDTAFTYLWSVKKDGVAFALPAGVAANAATFSFTPTDRGAAGTALYEVTLEVTDDDGQKAIAKSTFPVENIAPTFDASTPVTGIPAGPVNEGATLTLGPNARDSGTTAGDALSYAWYAWSSKRTPAVEVEAATTSRDSTSLAAAGWPASALAAIRPGMLLSVVGTAEEAPFLPATFVTRIEGTTIRLSRPLQASATLRIGFTAPDAAATSPAFALKPGDDGIFTVAVTATDKAGGSAMHDFPIEVVNVAPSAKLVTADGKLAYEQGASIGFRFDAATDPSDADKAALRYSFDLDDDGTWEVVDSASNLFTTAAIEVDGSRTVRARVSDDDGGSSESTLTVKIGNDAPEVTTLVDRAGTSSSSAAARFAAFGSLGARGPVTSGPGVITAPGRRIVLDGTFADAGMAIDTHRGEVEIVNDRTKAKTVLPLAIDPATNRFMIAYTFAPPAPGAAEDTYVVTARVTDDKSGTPVTRSVSVLPVGASEDIFAPVVTGVSVTASRQGTLLIGDTITYTVTFDQRVIVAGTPGLRLTIGSQTRIALAEPRATLGTTVSFTYRIAAGDSAAITDLRFAGTFDLSAGQIANESGTTTDSSFTPPTLPATQVDGLRPAAPPVSLASDTGISNADFITQSGVINMTAKAAGLMQAGTLWQWTADGGRTWSALLAQTVTSFTLPKSATVATDVFEREMVKTRIVSAGGNVGPETVFPGRITVDTRAPSLVRFTSPNEAGSYRAGATIQVQAEMSEPVIAGAEFTATLNTLPTPTTVVLKAPAGGGALLTGAFTVTATQSVASLKVTSFKAGVAGITDFAGNKWAPTTVVPAGAGNIDGNRPITIDNVAPALVSLSSSTPSGIYREGAEVALTATLSERPAAGAVLSVTLNNRTTGPAVVELRPSATGNTLVGSYVVKAGDATPAGGFLTVTDARPGTGTTDLAGNPLAAFTLASLPNVAAAKIVVDAQAPAAVRLTLAEDTGFSAADGVTRNGTINVLGVENGANWKWSRDGGSTFTAGSGASFSLPAGEYAPGEIVVRQADAAGNEGPDVAFPTALDIDPVAPRVDSFSTSASAGRYRADTVVPVVATLSESVPAGTSVVATLSTGAAVTLTAASEGTTLAGQYVVAAGHNTPMLVVRSFTAAGAVDKAGNALLTTMPAAWLNLDANRTNIIAIDTLAPAAPVLSLAKDTGVSGTDGITSSGLMNLAGLEANATWGWSVDGGATFTPGTGKSFILPANPVTYAAGAVIVKQADAAGNESPIAVNAKAIRVDATAPAVQSFAASVAPGSHKAGTAIGITATFAENVVGGGSIEALLSNGRTVTLTNATRTNVLSGSYTVAEGHDVGSLKVTSFTASRIVDVAGNALTSTAVPAGAANLGGTGTIRIDTTPPGGVGLALKTDTGTKSDDLVTRDGTITVSGLEAGDAVKWSADGGVSWKPATGGSFLLADGSYPAGTIRAVRSDAAGNEGPVTTFDRAIVVDSVNGIESISTSLPSGSYREGTSIPISVSLTDAVPAATKLLLSLNTAIGGTATKVEVFAASAGKMLSGTYSVVAGHNVAALRVTKIEGSAATDLAGNAFSTALPPDARNLGDGKTIHIDTTSPAALTFGLASDEGPRNNDWVTRDGQVNVTGLEADATWGWSTDSGKTFKTASGAVFTLPQGTYPAGTVIVRQSDAAGNVGPTAANAAAITIESVAPKVLAFTTGAVPGRYRAEVTLTIKATMSEPVKAGSQILATLTTGAIVTLTAATEGTLLVGTYTIAPGQNTDRLQVTTFTANGLVDIAGNPADTTVPTGAGNLDEAGARIIAIDTTAPAKVTLALSADTGASATDGVTRDKTLKIGNLEAGAAVEWRTKATDPFVRSPITLADGAYELGTIEVRQVDAAGNAGPTATNDKKWTIDTVAPRITAVSTTTAAGFYKDGVAIPITATADETIAAGSAVVLTLSSGTTAKPAKVELKIASAGDRIAGTYTVSDGENTDVLTATGVYTDSKTGSWNTVVDLAGNPWDGTIPVAANIDANKSKTIVIDTVEPAAPTISLAEDTGTAGDWITRNGTVNVAGLEAGGDWFWNADWGKAEAYQKMTSSSFTLGPNQQYAVNQILVLQRDKAGNASPITKNTSVIRVDTTLPTIQSFTTSAAAGNYATGKSLWITATMSEAVSASARITVTLSSGTTAAPVTVTLAPNATRTGLIGSYTVAAGQKTSLLKVISFTVSGLTDDAGNTQVSTSLPSLNLDEAGKKVITVNA